MPTVFKTVEIKETHTQTGAYTHTPTHTMDSYNGFILCLHIVLRLQKA